MTDIVVIDSWMDVGQYLSNTLADQLLINPFLLLHQTGPTPAKILLYLFLTGCYMFKYIKSLCYNYITCSSPTTKYTSLHYTHITLCLSTGILVSFVVKTWLKWQIMANNSKFNYSSSQELPNV